MAILFLPIERFIVEILNLIIIKDYSHREVIFLWQSDFILMGFSELAQ